MYVGNKTKTEKTGTTAETALVYTVGYSLQNTGISDLDPLTWKLP